MVVKMVKNPLGLSSFILFKEILLMKIKRYYGVYIWNPQIVFDIKILQQVDDTALRLADERSAKML